MTQNNFDLSNIKRQLVSGEVPTGSILGKVMNDLSPTELESLRGKAAEGMLGLELEKIAMAHRFQSSNVEIQEFIAIIKDLERNAGRTSTYKAKGEFNTASGRTTIEAKKGCYIATAVYGNENHPNVIILRDFRDDVLSKRRLGILFCNVYYYFSPFLSKYFKSGTLSCCGRYLLDRFCCYVNNWRLRNR